jgi:Ca2+-transporting ATPase
MAGKTSSSEIRWHNLSVYDLFAELGSNWDGLTQEEAAKRLVKFGPNELVEKKRVSALSIFLGQFKSFLIILLLAAVGLSFVLGEKTDAIVILAIIVLAAGLGFIQEYRAERAMEALKKMAALTATVIRGGKEIELPARELVPGDTILLRTGDKIPADGRLIESVNLKAEEAPLTGESVPVEKTSEAIAGEVGVTDRHNCVFTGTTAVYGRGTAIVTGTGMSTEFGKIAQMLAEVTEEQTPLQVNLDRMGKWIAIGAIVLCFLLASVGIWRGHEVLEMLLWGVSLVVAAVPESLPAVVTISLALGVQRMVKCNALVRKLSAVETLGCTTVICSDKTGTLTQDQMTVRQIWADGRLFEVTGVGYEPKGEFRVDGKVVDPKQDSALQILLQAGSLCSDTALVQDGGAWRVKGDPTEGALVVAAAKAGLLQKELAGQFPRVGEIPFTSETKRMTTVHKTPRGRIAYSKGAPEVILGSCAYILSEGREAGLFPEDREGILNRAQEMASQALRVLGIAYKRLPDADDVSGLAEREMVFVGLAGMIDPPRQEVKEAIRLCEQAGIESVMITGDHKSTAVAIARELGLLKKGESVTGAELDALTDKQFDSHVENIEVYARVSPAHKLRVVEALSKKRHVVAVTGDGVNDAPALKKADIGVAMGITGTDVSKEAADMVLTDDNFASIVAAVKEGRIIFGNIKKYMVYLLSCNLGEILLMAASVLFGPLLGIPPGALPLIAVQILFVNLATDGLPAIALSVDPPEPDIMRQKPRPKGQTIFTGPVLKYIAGVGFWTGLVSLCAFLWALDSGKSLIEAQCVCFVTLILVQFFNAFNCRSFSRSLFSIGIWTNMWLWLAVASQIVLLLLIVYLPVLQGPFNTYALDRADWIFSVFAASTVFIVVEIAKLMSSLSKTQAPAPTST